jgi:hypothetical protein
MTTLNECQQAMLKAEKRERQMGVVLQVLGVATMLTAIGGHFCVAAHQASASARK